MGRIPRLWISAASIVVMIVVGIAVGRVVRGAPSAPPAAASSTATDELGGVLQESDFDLDGRDQVTAADIVPVPQRVIPVLEPVLVSMDPSAGDELLEIDVPTADAPRIPVGGSAAAPTYSGSTGSFAPADQVSRVLTGADNAAPDSGSTTADTPSTTADTVSAPVDTAITTADTAISPTDTDARGGSTGDVDDEESESSPVPPLVFVSDLGIFLEIPPIEFDRCAGLVPGESPPDDCGPGVGATLLGLGTPPGPLAFFDLGHYLELTTPDGLTCPTDTPSAGAGQRAGTLFSHAPLSSVEAQYRPHGTDLAWTDIEIAPSSADEISWWMSRFATTEWSIDWGAAPMCFVIDADPEISYEIRGSGVDNFGQPVEAYLGILPADAPSLRPPTRATVTGVVPVANVTAWTHSGGMVNFRTRTVSDTDTDPDCLLARTADETLTFVSTSSAPRSASIYDPLYSKLIGAHLPVPLGGRLLVCVDIFHTDNPLRPFVTDRVLVDAPTRQQPRIVLEGIRRIGDETIQSGLRVTSGGEAGARDIDYCNRGQVLPELPPGAAYPVDEVLWECGRVGSRPPDTDGDFEVPIQIWRPDGVGRTTLNEVAIPVRMNDCGREACDRPSEWYEIPFSSETGRAGFVGIAVVRVEYPIVDGPASSDGGAVLLDQVEPALLAEQPRLTRPVATYFDTDSPFFQDVELSFFSDRPLRLGLSTFELFGEPCFEGVDVPLSDEFSEEFTIRVSNLCAGYAYGHIVHAIDEAGIEYEIRTAWGSVPRTAAAHFDTRIELLGGPDLPRLGFLYGPSVMVDGQNATFYWWEPFAAFTGTHVQCVGLDRTTLLQNGRPRIRLIGTTLDVAFSVEITTTGEDDCSGRSSSGLGVLTFEGSFTREQIASDEPLVLVSDTDQPLQVRITLTRTSDWD